jgi:hypothetical protein
LGILFQFHHFQRLLLRFYKQVDVGSKFKVQAAVAGHMSTLQQLCSCLKRYIRDRRFVLLNSGGMFVKRAINGMLGLVSMRNKQNPWLLKLHKLLSNQHAKLRDEKDG